MNAATGDPPAPGHGFCEAPIPCSVERNERGDRGPAIHEIWTASCGGHLHENCTSSCSSGYESTKPQAVYTCMSSPSCASHNHITYWVDAVTHEAPPSGQGLLGCVALPCSLYPPGQDEQWVSSCGSHLSEYCTAECSHNTQPATGKASEDYVCLGSPSCPRSASSCWVDATTHEPPPENPHTGQKVGFLGCHQCSLDPPGQHEVWHDSCDATIYTGNCMAECAPGYESSIRQTTAYYLCRPDAECRHNIDPHLRHELMSFAGLMNTHMNILG